MNDIDRVVGRLEATQDAIKESLEFIREDVAEMRLEVQGLNRWKWKVLGGSAVVTGLVSLIAAVLGH